MSATVVAIIIAAVDRNKVFRIQIQSIIIIKYETISAPSQHVLWFAHLGDVVVVLWTLFFPS